MLLEEDPGPAPEPVTSDNEPAVAKRAASRGCALRDCVALPDVRYARAALRKRRPVIAARGCSAKGNSRAIEGPQARTSAVG